MELDRKDLRAFIHESNKIEGIVREPTRWEMEMAKAFLDLETISVSDLENFVNVFQPGAKLRDKKGMDVRVGNHKPPPGGPHITSEFEVVLRRIERNCPEETPYRIHKWFESLHPFMDGNGRSGRMLWLWMMGGDYIPFRGFLHSFYYQVLEEGR